MSDTDPTYFRIVECTREEARKIAEETGVKPALVSYGQLAMLFDTAHREYTTAFDLYRWSKLPSPWREKIALENARDWSSVAHWVANGMTGEHIEIDETGFLSEEATRDWRRRQEMNDED